MTGVPASAQVTTWSGTGDWSEALKWSLLTIPGPSNTATVSSGTLSVSDDQSVGALILSGGAINGTGTLTITSTGSTWSGGTMNGSAGSGLKINSGASLTISGAVDHDYNLRVITNAGTINWSAGNLRSGSSGGIVNNLTFNDSTTGSVQINNAYSGAVSTFTNSATGTYTKSGAGTTTISVPFTNAGSVNVNAGTLALTGGGSASATGTFAIGAGTTFNLGSGTYTLANGSALTGTGTFVVSGGALSVSAGTLTLPNLTLNGGALDGAGGALIAGFNQSAGNISLAAFTLTGTPTWTGGTWNAGSASTALLPAGTTLALSSGAAHDYNLRVITNAGTINWSAGDLRSGSSGGILNNSAFNDTNTGAVQINNVYGGAISNFTNSATGTYTKSGTGTTTVTALFHNAGIVNVNAGTLALTGGGTNTATGTLAIGAGTTFNLGGGTYTLANGSALTGTGTFVVSGGALSVSAGTLTLPNLTFSGGALDGAGGALIAGFNQSAGNISLAAFTLTGTPTWTGGTWNSGSASTASLQSGTTLTLAAGTDYDYNLRTITNAGTIHWSGGNLRSGSSGGLINTFAFNDTNTGAVQINNVYGGAVSNFTNSATGTYTKSGAGTTTVTALFHNAGIVNLNAGTLALNGGGTASTGSVFNIGAGTLLSFGGGTYTLANGSNLAFTGTTTITGGSVILNAGAFSPPSLVMTGGALTTLDPGSTSSIPIITLSAGTITTAGTLTTPELIQTGGTLSAKVLTLTSNITWSGGNWNSASASTASLASGTTLTVSSADFDYNLRTITNNGTINWSAGNLRSGSSGGIVNNLTFNDSTTGSVQINNAYSGAVSTFTNSATGTYTKSGAGTTTVTVPFTNAGSVNVNAGTLALTGGGSASATGTFAIGAGTTFNLGSGTYTLANGSALTGTGAFVVSGGALSVSAGTLTLPNLTLNGGALDGAGGALIAGFNQSAGNISLAAFTLTGTPTWTGGTWNAGSASTALLPAGTTLALSSGAAHDYNLRVITNAGTINWSAGDLRSGSSGGILNNSAFNDTNPGAVQINNVYSGAISNFTNSATGIYTKSGAGTTTVTALFHNAGIVNVNAGTFALNGGGTNTATGTLAIGAGTTFSLGGGTYTLANGSALTGSGTFVLSAGTLSVSAGTLTLPNLTFSGGALDGAGGALIAGFNQSAGNIALSTFTLTGTPTWTGGTWNSGSASTATLQSGTTLTLAAGTDYDYNLRTITNAGTIHWSGGNLRSGSSGGLINTFAFNDTNTGAVQINNVYGGALSTFTNSATGTYTKSGAGTTTVTVPFTNDGTVAVQSGTLALNAGVTNNGGTFQALAGATIEFGGTTTRTFNSGTVFSGTGAKIITGATTVFSGSITTQNLTFASGTLYGTSVLHGSMAWSGGGFAGVSNTFGVATDGVLTISEPATKYLYNGFNATDGRILDNSGSVVWQAGDLLLGDSAQIINRSSTGTFSISGAGTLGYAGFGLPVSFTNNGSLLKVSGSGTTVVGVAFTNTGTIAVDDSTLQFTASFTNTNGSIALANGGALISTGSIALGTGALAGAGTITAPSVSAGGPVSPGNSPGLLTLTGNLTLLATSNLLIDLGGTTQGTDHDFLSVGGTAALDGTLAVKFTNGFESSVSNANTFTFLTASSLTGAFANVPTNGLRIFTTDGFGSFQVNFGAGSTFAANSIVLSNFVAIPEPSTYALLLLGAGALALGARRQRRRS